MMLAAYFSVQYMTASCLLHASLRFLKLKTITHAKYCVRNMLWMISYKIDIFLLVNNFVHLIKIFRFFQS